jgi:protein TonB
MTAQHAVPRYDDSDSANNRLKGRFRALFWSSIIVATTVHFGAFVYWPELTAEDFSVEVEELMVFELPPEIEVPPPPKAIARPATPVIATTEVNEDITIAPTTFATNPVDALPPPPQLEEKVVAIEDAPRFTPFTVAPEILNRGEIITALSRAYPPLLRDAGIGGVVKVFFFIDDTGVVRSTRVQETSGYEQLDNAALAVASLYRFSPALNRDAKVPVWVAFPVEFKVIR